MSDSFWSVPPPEPAVDEKRVDVWRIDLDRDAEVVAELSSFLSPDEQARRARFVFDRERRRYAVARGTLRRLLGRYLGVAADEVRLDEGAGGKPHLRNHEVQFNVSHSGELALVAVASGRRVGVDVERERAVGEALSIARRWFSATERELIERERDDLRARRFLECWTSKEAQVKAVGSGVWSLEAADVWRAMPRRHYRLDDARAEGWWTLQEIPAGDAFIAALVVEGDDDWSLQAFDAGRAE